MSNTRSSPLKQRVPHSTNLTAKVGSTEPRRSAFSIGDRVRLSALGTSRCPRLANKVGFIVGLSVYVNSVAVLLDGNKSPRTIHGAYLEALMGHADELVLGTLEP